MSARPRAAIAALALALALAGCLGQIDRDEETSAESDAAGEALGPVAPGGPARPPPDVALREVVAGLAQPTGMATAPTGQDRLFVLEQPGRVRLVEDGRLHEQPYLDLTDEVTPPAQRGPEQGLLGLAFSPAFADNGHLYVSYTNRTGTSLLERYTVEDPLQGRPTGEGQLLLSVPQHDAEHNGGRLTFGPDGYLYHGLGDGGGGGDPAGNGQDPTTPLAAILRMDVSGERPEPPPDNPFVGEEGHDLVWAYGLRNPWRFSFDRETGDLYIGDVGQASFEEIDRQPASSAGGENYGWNKWEAEEVHDGEPSREGYTFPILSYPQEGQACAVVGGYVYRGEAIPTLQGYYLYADHCMGTIWAAQDTSEGWRSDVVLDTAYKITSFGEDREGEVYVVARGGSLLRIVQP